MLGDLSAVLLLAAGLKIPIIIKTLTMDWAQELLSKKCRSGTHIRVGTLLVSGRLMKVLVIHICRGSDYFVAGKKLMG